MKKKTRVVEEAKQVLGKAYQKVLKWLEEASRESPVAPIFKKITH